MKQNYIALLLLLLSWSILAQPNIIKEESYRWDGVDSEWKKTELIERTFNSNNQVLTESTSVWSSANGGWNIQSKFTYEYDDDNLVYQRSESSDLFTNGTDEEKLTLNSEVITAYRVDGTLEKESTITYNEEGENYERTAYYNEQGCLTSRTSNGFSNGWIYTCNDDGQLIESIAGGPTGFERYIINYFYDEYGNLSQRKRWRRDTIPGDLYLYYGDVYFYDADGTGVYSYLYFNPDPSYQVLTEWTDEGKIASGKIIIHDSISGEEIILAQIERSYDGRKLKEVSTSSTHYFLNDTFTTDIQKSYLYNSDNYLIREQINTASTRDGDEGSFSRNSSEIINNEINCHGLMTEKLSRVLTSSGTSFNSKTIFTYDNKLADCDFAKENGVVLFPNPSSGQVSIFSPNLNRNNSVINIYDALGKLVFNSNTCCDQKQIDLQLGDLTNGIYYVSIKNEVIDKTEKLFILK